MCIHSEGKKWSRISLVLVAVSFTIGLINIAYGQTLDNQTTVNTTDFSIDIPDNWAYQNLENRFWEQVWISLIPTEFSNFVINTSQELIGESILNGGAYSFFARDSEYPYRNVPVEAYTQYKMYNIQSYPETIFSQQNVTIDGEKAIKFHRTALNNLTNIQLIDYYVIHDGKPYFIHYVANAKDFEKYLPQFEQIVKSFRFVDRIK